MNGRLPRRPVERYGDQTGATVGSLAMVGATVGCPSHRAALPPVVHERYGALAPPCERLHTGTPVKR